MLNRKPREKTGVDRAIDGLLVDMSRCPTESDEYAKMVDQVVKLQALQAAEKPKRISPDTIAIISANLLGILIIVAYERANVASSKALGFVMKLK